MRVEANQINQNILELRKRQELEKLELERIKAQAIAAKAKAAREEALAAQRRAAAMESHQRAMSLAQLGWLSEPEETTVAFPAITSRRGGGIPRLSRNIQVDIPVPKPKRITFNDIPQIQFF